MIFVKLLGKDIVDGLDFVFTTIIICYLHLKLHGTL